MKIKSIITFVLLFIFTFAVSAQEKKAELPTNKTDSSTLNEPRKQQIIGFSKPEQMFHLLEGKWIFADMTCAEPYTVTVTTDRKSIKFQYAKPQKWSDGTEHDFFVYKVLEIGKYYIRTQIEGEKRITSDGKPVTWDFMFLSPNEFVWHRTDWEGLNSTSTVKRCDDGKRRTFTKTN
jgi:hypothetical protein